MGGGLLILESPDPGIFSNSGGGGGVIIWCLCLCTESPKTGGTLCFANEKSWLTSEPSKMLNFLSPYYSSYRNPKGSSPKSQPEDRQEIAGL